ncbi:MAG: bifunctional riboflavin kinase/FAD synthetase [Steroidobacteraceae bacterium]
MQLIRGLHNLRAHHRGCVVTIGNFDGVHRGHQEILRLLSTRAREHGLPGAVISFEPLPREYFDPERAPARLTRFRERFEALDRYGTERFLCLRFNREIRDMDAPRFIDAVLVRGLGARHVLIGHDFHFGRDRSGTIELLRTTGAQAGFTVEEIRPVTDTGERISSTLVRAALAGGDLSRARELLGRPYAMSGRVIHGEKLGRKLGFPTANILPQRLHVPVSGVFAARVHGGGLRDHPAVVNVGTRPVVEGEQTLIEAHVLDFAGDLYGAYLQVDFIARLRAEEWFPSLDALVEQMRLDEQQARRILTAASPHAP